MNVPERFGPIIEELLKQLEYAEKANGFIPDVQLVEKAMFKKMVESLHELNSNATSRTATRPTQNS